MKLKVNSSINVNKKVKINITGIIIEKSMLAQWLNDLQG